MKDISTVGASVEIKFGDETVTITEFSDEGTPFEAPDVDVTENAKSLNGEMISSRKPTVYPVSVTVIPGSLADRKLSLFMKKNSLQSGASAVGSKLKVSSLVVSVPSLNDTEVTSRKYKYANGRIKSGPTGPSTSAEGRQSARTFTFEFQDFDPFTSAK